MIGSPINIYSVIEWAIKYVVLFPAMQRLLAEWAGDFFMALYLID